MSEPGYVAFAAAVERRRIAGSAWRTGLAFFMLTTALFDLLSLSVGGGGLASALLTWLSRVLPGGMKGPFTVTFMALLLDGGALAFGLFNLANSPWRRWIGPSLRNNVPFKLAYDVARHGTTGSAPAQRTAWGMLALQVLAFAGVTLMFRPAYGLMLHWSSMPAFGAVVLLLVFAYLAVWIAWMLYDSAVVRPGTVARGDRATVLGVAVGIAISVPATIGTDAAMDLLRAYSLTPSGSLWFRLTAFYGAACTLIAITLLCFGSVSDRDVEILTIDANSAAPRVDLPDCTGGEYAPFLFRVQTNGNQIVLLSTPPNAPTHTELLTTLDSHDLTTGRYTVVNLSALARRQGQSVGIGYLMMNGRFECELDVSLATLSVETFISDLRQEGGAFPLAAFAVVCDRVLAEGMQAGTMQALFRDAAEAVEAELSSLLPGPFPEIRSLRDSATRAANAAGDGMDHQVAVFQDQNRSALDASLDRQLAQSTIDRIADLRQSFLNQSATLLNSLRGEDQLRAVVFRKASETAAEGLDALVAVYVTDPAMQQAARRLLRLFTIRVNDVRVRRSEASIDVETALHTIERDLQARHDRAIEGIRQVSRAVGESQMDLVRTVMTSPMAPHGVRTRVGERIAEALGRDDSARAIPGSAAWPAVGREAAGRLPDQPAAPLPGQALPGTAREPAPRSRPAPPDPADGDPF